MKPVPVEQQQSLVERLMQACGGAYCPATRRKYFITGPQWAAAYEGQALFHAPTRSPVGFEEVIRQYGQIGIGHWCTHDTDVIPTEALGTGGQDAIVAPHRRRAATRTASPVPWSPPKRFTTPCGPPVPRRKRPVREYASWRLKNTVDIGHELGAQFAVYWPGSLGLLGARRDRGNADAALVRRGA